VPIAANRWPAARGLLLRRSREFNAAPPDVSRPAWSVGRRPQRSADRIGRHADCERADLGAKPESGCSEPSASTQVAAIHGDGIIHADTCRDRMALEEAGSRRARGYALNESRFPGARTGGEETETVCASKTRRDAELETALDEASWPSWHRDVWRWSGIHSTECRTRGARSRAFHRAHHSQS
jgi:hypothetical protein